jgi:putative oxidoreductase
MTRTADGIMRTWGLVPLRLVVGLVFLMHGGQKILDFGLSGVSDMLAKLGFPMATFFAIVLMVLEPLGGLAVLLGVYTRPLAFLLAVEMSIAIPVARWKGGFFTPYGYEFELTLLGACLTIALLGAGDISLQRLLRRPPDQST